MNDSGTLEILMVSGGLATEWLKLHHFEHQRKRRDKHVRFLAGEMDAGRFRELTPINFGVLNGHPYLVNGQHTLAALELHGGPIKLVVIRQTVESEEALARLYNTHDSGLSRTWSDAYAAMGLNQRYDMSDIEVNAYGRAVPFIGGGFGYRAVREYLSHRSKDLRIGIMETYHPSAKLYLKCLETAEPPIRRALLQPPLMALGTYTIHYDADLAVSFWSLAADDQKLAKTDPPKVATILAQRVTRRNQKALVGLAQSVVVAWNAYVQGKPVKNPKLIGGTKSLPPSDVVRILGTPLAQSAAEPEPLPLEQEEVFEQAREMFGEEDPARPRDIRPRPELHPDI